MKPILLFALAVVAFPAHASYVDLANHVRTVPIKESTQLDQLAAVRAQSLCTKEFSHAGWTASFKGLTYQWIGENLAKDFPDEASTEAAWLASPTHRANIVASRYQFMGTGTACGITVELFGGHV